MKLKDYLGQGCTEPGSQVAAVQRVINGPSLQNLLTVIAQNFEVAVRYLENLCTPLL